MTGVREVSGLFLRGGHVIDPANGINTRLDVLIRDGRIEELRPPSEWNVVPPDIEIREVDGLIVTPGLVDLHGHWYDGSAYGVDPAVSLRSGVTTAVDAGTAGFVNFASFRRSTIDGAPVRVLAFVNIAALGISTTLSGELDTPAHVRPSETVVTIRANPGVAVGVKVRLSAATLTGSAPAALEAALEAARAVGQPVMVDVGGPGDFMPDALDRLGPGDILTHCFTGGGATILDASGRIRPQAVAARERGVLFDIGHGCGSFSWRTARAALGEGFAPDSLSSDLHRYSIDAIGVELHTLMAKFLALGMPLRDVVSRVTVGPARAIGLPDPSLRPGSVADIAVFRIIEEDVQLRDASGAVVEGRQRIEPVLTIVAGRAVDPRSVSVTLRPFVEADGALNCGQPVEMS